jgi:hypothetical protein
MKYAGDNFKNMEEVWKDIEGYEGLYEASNIGRLRRKGSVNVRKFGDNGHGYKHVPLSKNNIIKNHYVHRIIATAFIPNPNNKATVNHKNGNKSDNHVENLEWATQSENSKHGFDTGLIVQNKGRDNPTSKPVRQYSLNGEFIMDFDSLTDAGKKLGITTFTIGQAAVGKYKQAGGYQWRFIKDNIPKLPSIGKKGNGEKAVMQFTKDGRFIAEFESMNEAYRKTGISQQGISNVCGGKLKTTGGFIWKLKNIRHEDI